MKNFNTKEGSLDYYYCFKGDNDSPQSISDLIENSKCNVINKSIEIEKNITRNNLDFKKEYTAVFDEVLKEEEENMLIDIKKNFNPAEFEFEQKTEDGRIIIDIINSFTDKIEKQYVLNTPDYIMKEFIENVSSEKRYLGSKAVYDYFLFQPIKSNNSKYEWINVQAIVYPSGQLIVRYSFKFEGVNSCNFTNNSDITTNYTEVQVPRYIKYNSEEINYDENIIKLDESIELYNRYICSILGQDYSEIDSFEVIILNDYDNIPSDFGKMNYDYKEAFYFFINRPYGFGNKQSNKIYEDFISSRYDVNKYLSIFAGTNNRILMAYNKHFDSIKKEIEKENLNLDEKSLDKYNMASSYILPVIKLILINKSFLKSVDKVDFKDKPTLKQVMKIKNELLIAKDYKFSYLRNSYGSVQLAYKYLEEKITNFLPGKILDEKLELYASMITSNESIQKEENSNKIAFFATIITILFGTESIDKFLQFIKPNILNLMNEFLGENVAKETIAVLFKIKSNIPIISSIKLSFILWIILLIIVMKIFYKNKLHTTFQSFDNTNSRKVYK